MKSHSQADLDIDVTIGSRLRAERKRLRLNQAAMAAVGGVSLQTQHRYEAGGLPATEYLLRIGEAGADWYWIVTGQRIDAGPLDSDTADLVQVFVELPRAMREAVVQHVHALKDALRPETDRPTLHERRIDYRAGGES